MSKKGGNPDNLIVPSSDEARRYGSLGGIKSGEVRRKKKDLKDAVLSLLNSEDFTIEGVEGNVDGNTAIVASLFMKALEGNVQAFTALRDTAGQKPVETVNVNDTRPKAIAIEFVDKSNPKKGKGDPKIVGESSPIVGDKK